MLDEFVFYYYYYFLHYYFFEPTPSQNTSHPLFSSYEYGSMIDSQKIVGVGFGYGAYLLNFWNGLEQRDKVIHFSAIVSHGGVFDTRTMYYEMDVSKFKGRGE